MERAPLQAVSVVVCNYNGEEHLRPCLDALFALEGPVDEIVVVDNESTDASVAIIEAEYPKVRLIRSGHNGGPAPARNLGMREAKNAWVFAVDNDAVLEPDVLVKLIAAAKANERAVILQPRSVFATEPSRVHYDGGSFHYAGLIALRNFYVPLDRAVGEGVCETDCSVSVALLLDRDLVLECGGYDERYFILFEDLDLSYRLRSEGHLILSVEDAICHHRGGTPGISFRDGKNYPKSRVFYHSRNRWLYLAKCYRTRTLFAAAPGLLVYEFVWFGFALISGSAGSWLAGKREVWKLRADTAQMRAHARSRRTLRDRDLLVGGPLTTTPALASSTLKRTVLGGLNVTLKLWWNLIGRHFAA